MFYCNILSLPATIILTFITEWEGISTFEGYGNIGFQVSVFKFIITIYYYYYIFFRDFLTQI